MIFTLHMAETETQQLKHKSALLSGECSLDYSLLGSVYNMNDSLLYQCLSVHLTTVIWLFSRKVDVTDANTVFVCLSPFVRLIYAPSSSFPGSVSSSHLLQNRSPCLTSSSKFSLWHVVAVIFLWHEFYFAKCCMRPCTLCMRRRAGDGRTTYLSIHMWICAQLYHLCGADSGSPQ